MLAGPSRALNAAIGRAAEEAVRHGDRRVGTDHLLLGLLHDDDVAATLGSDVEFARATARELDQAALVAIGVDLSEAPESATRVRVGPVPLTSGSRAMIARAAAIAEAARARRAEPRHLLEALLAAEEPDPAATLLAAIRARS